MFFGQRKRYAPSTVNDVVVSPERFEIPTEYPHEPTLGSLVFECSFSRNEAEGWLNRDIENYEIDHNTGLASASV
jgi:hypothetical protein